MQLKLRAYKKIYFSLFLFTLLSLTPLFAHPHVAIESKLNFVFEDNKLEGVYVEWKFDHFFSADIISWLDVDKNGQFDEKESVEVYNNAFINLRHYYYYTFIRQGSERTNPSKVEQFRARIEKGQMIYRFYIDLSQYPKGELYFANYDYTFFTDISYPESAGIEFTLKNSSIKPQYSISANKDYPVYYNPLGAIDDTRVYYKWEKGLQTYYPIEVKISY